MTLTLNIDSALEQRLREQAAKQGVRPDSYVVAAIEERLRLDSRPSAQLNHQESELLSQIGVGLPEETWDRYDQLNTKQRDNALTADEHAELEQLINTVEVDHARRISQLVKLAQLRNVPIESLMRELGIAPRPPRNGNHE
ncbi:MAG TPA: hypothetical protein VK797_26840 [Tepidisphaeraceae bacterium]|jgi:hypothetical protein|nr:hypothetical protein [Tepidisphaeraceae bacterium]